LSEIQFFRDDHLCKNGIRRVEWSNYQHPPPKQVYDVYIQYWADIRFKI
jgi:hypothetical protein